MKLNNKGWGVFQMAWMTGIILFFFFLAIILIYRYYHAMGYQIIDREVITARSHEEMLDDLQEAGIRYMNYNYPNIKTLKQEKLTSTKLFQAGLFAKDLYGDCTGYVLIEKHNGIGNTKSYIKCSDYKSPGYDNN